MKVRNLKRLIKEQSDRLSIKGASIKITKDGIIVETAINNDMRKVNGLATLVKSYLVAEGLKIDGFNINKAGNAIKSKYFISEAVFQEDEDNEEEIVPTHVASTEIDIYDPEPEEVMEDPMADLSDEEYVKAVVGEVDYSKVPDDEESIEIAINDDLDSFFDDGAEETMTVDVNAHNGEGWITKDEFNGLPESRKNPTRKKTMVKEASGNPYGDHYTADRWIYKTGQGGWWMEYDTTDSFWAKSDLMALKKLALMKAEYPVNEQGYRDLTKMLKQTTVRGGDARKDAPGTGVDFSDSEFWIEMIKMLGDEEIAYANLTSPNGTVFQDDDYRPSSPMMKKWERVKKLSQQTPENDWDDSIDEIEEDI